MMNMPPRSYLIGSPFTISDDHEVIFTNDEDRVHFILQRPPEKRPETITSGTLTAAQIAPGKITAAQIGAGTITATLCPAIGSVAGGQILAATPTTSRLGMITKGIIQSDEL